MGRRRMQTITTAKKFACRTDGAVTTWFAILLIPMLGMTFGAIKFAEFSSHRSGMIDAMDAAGLGLARQMEFEDLEACDLAAADTTDPTDVVGQDRLRLERFAREFFEENYPEYDNLFSDEQLSRPFDLSRDMKFELNCAYVEVAATAYVDMGGTLGNYFGVGALPLDLEVEISLPGAGRVEIALVLDVTSSMCYADSAGSGPPCAAVGSRRIDKLLTAVDGMLDDRNIFGPADDATNNFVRMSIVPFNTMVNPGPTYAGTSFDGLRTDRTMDWMDTSANALYHGANFIHAEIDGTVTGPNYYNNPDPAGTVTSWTRCATEGGSCTVPPNTPVRYGANGTYAFATKSGQFDCDNDTFGDPLRGVRKFCDQGETTPILSTNVTSYRTVVDADRKVNHFDLFNSVGANGATWKGCVEARPFPMDEGLFPPGAGIADIDAMWIEPDFVASGTPDMQSSWSRMKPQATLSYTAGRTADTRFVPFFHGDEPNCSLKRDLNGDGDTNDLVDRDACTFLLPSGATQVLRAHMSADWVDLDFVPSFFLNTQEGRTEPGIADYELQQNDYRNHDFIDDTTFLLPFDSVNSAYADDDDFESYRNLVLDIHEHISSDTSKSNCFGSQIEYQSIFNQDLIDIVNRLDINDCVLDEFKLRQAYVGTYDDTIGRYVGKYENPELSSHDRARDEPTDYLSAGVGPNRGCAGPIRPLTSSKADVLATMNALEPGGSTNTAIGMVWGWRTLSHNPPFVEGADPNTPTGGRWRKYAVLMSDGGNFFNATQESDGAGGLVNTTHNLSAMGLYGYLAEDRLGIFQGNAYTAYSTQYAEEFDRKTVRICHRMREQGIKIFTIGFAIDAGSRPDRMLAACAVDADAYTLAADGDDLADAFKDITEQIVELHVSG